MTSIGWAEFLPLNLRRDLDLRPLLCFQLGRQLLLQRRPLLLQLGCLIFHIGLGKRMPSDGAHRD